MSSMIGVPTRPSNVRRGLHGRVMCTSHGDAFIMSEIRDRFVANCQIIAEVCHLGDMPNVRVKVDGIGQSAKRVEIALEESFDAGLAAILDVACLEANSDTWLSLNKKEALHPPANGRFFSVARPGDLVWVMAPSFRSERSSHTVAAAEDHNMSIADDYAPDPFRAEALLGMIDGLASSQATLDARAIAASLVHSAAKDSGFESAANSDKPCVDGSDSQCADIGCWRREYSSPSLAGKMSFKASVFEMAGSQVIYVNIPSSAYGIRQHILPNIMLRLPDLRSHTSVRAILDPIYQAIKSKLMVWAANALLLGDGRQQQCGLLALPTEALANAFSQLDFADVAVLASVSRRLRAVTAERSIWECLLKKEFSQEATAGKDPRELFKQAISDRKRRREALQSMHRPGGYRRDPHFAPAPRLPPALPGIVGGDYDRLPPSLANMPMHAWGSGHGCVAPMMQAQEHHVSGTTGGVLGRAARREAGIGGGLGDRMHGPGGRAFGSNAGFGGFGGGPFRGRPF